MSASFRVFDVSIKPGAVHLSEVQLFAYETEDVPRDQSGSVSCPASLNASQGFPCVSCHSRLLTDAPVPRNLYWGSLLAVIENY